MKLGVLDLTPVLEGADATEALRQSLLLAQLAERLGYTRYWAAEHHDLPKLGSAAPEVLLAHIGAQTSRIRLGSGAVLLPHYSPLKVAESFHLLASLYPGRIDLGIGRAPGGSAHATMALSGNFLERVQQMPQKLQALVELLEQRYTYEGGAVSAMPTPPVPPQLWLLGTNRKSAQFAATFGAGYVFGHFMSDEDGPVVLREYREAYKPSASAPKPAAIVAVGVICADTEQEAKRLAREAAATFIPQSGQPAGNNARSEDEAGSGSASGRSSRPPAAASGRRGIVGAPEQVRDALLALAGEHGTDELLVVCSIPSYAARLHAYELLAQALLPHQ
jgi:luciferase family oxidoreductase group 1